jgi:hypothetical protein
MELLRSWHGPPKSMVALMVDGDFIVVFFASNNCIQILS